MNKESVVTIKDEDYERVLVIKDAKHSLDCVKVFVDCGFEVTIKIRDQKE